MLGNPILLPRDGSPWRGWLRVPTVVPVPSIERSRQLPLPVILVTPGRVIPGVVSGSEGTQQAQDDEDTQKRNGGSHDFGSSKQTVHPV